MSITRVGVRQWWALGRLATVAPACLTTRELRQAVRAHRPSDPAKDVTDSLVRNGFIECSQLDGCATPGHEHLWRLTVRGEEARLMQRT